MSPHDVGVSGYRETKVCEGCGGGLQRAGYDEWGRFVCGGCVARGSLMAGERRAAESEAGGIHVELSDNPLKAAQQVRGILGGIVLLISFFMCGGFGFAAVGVTLFNEGDLTTGVGLGLVGLVLMATPFVFAVFRARRAKQAGKMDEPPPFRRG